MTAQNLIEDKRLIVIARNVPSEKLAQCIEALCSGGIKLVEIAFDQSQKVTDEQTALDIKKICEKFGDKICVGAGTVLTKKQVRLAKSAGAKFTVSPNTDKSIIRYAKKKGLCCISGAFSPSDIAVAIKSGADFIKLFPVNSLGVDYVKNVLAPFSSAKLLAVGKLTTEDFKKYLDAGVKGGAVGGAILDKDAIANGDFEKITENAKRFVQTVNEQ